LGISLACDFNLLKTSDFYVGTFNYSQCQIGKSVAGFIRNKSASSNDTNKSLSYLSQSQNALIDTGPDLPLGRAGLTIG